MFLMNKLSGNRFLVDTGASVSVFPHRSRQPVSPAVGVQLKTADDGTTINTFGSRHLALQFGSRQFDWNFLLADISMPILGADFLCKHCLLVDVAGSRLLDASSLEPIPTVSSVPANTKSQLYTALLSTTEEFQDLLAEYPDVVSSKGFSASTPKHPIRHTI